jgi:molybdate transport system substrate-binding protein
MTALPPGQLLVFLVWLTLQPAVVAADTISVAVASNFYPTLVKLIRVLSRDSAHEFNVISGSTGVLYAQIENGAPFDIFLAADTKRPALLDSHGKIEPGTRKTYAIGQLALWAPGIAVQVSREFLQSFKGVLAIANPDIAPYGVAANSLLSNLDLSRMQLVRGNNVGQTFQFVQTGNANAGLVALSQVLQHNIERRFFWSVEQGLYEPIEQQMVILHLSTGSSEFTTFLSSGTANHILTADGYQLPVREGR